MVPGKSGARFLIFAPQCKALGVYIREMLGLPFGATLAN
jgi:hypothetical protein